MTVKPRLGFLWGPAIGAAKKYFYREWTPESPYEALNMEYELHAEESMCRSSSIISFLPLKERTDGRTDDGIDGAGT